MGIPGVSLASDGIVGGVIESTSRIVRLCEPKTILSFLLVRWHL